MTVLPLASVLVISIHALRGEGDNKVSQMLGKTLISIHALRGEGDINITAEYI